MFQELKINGTTLPRPDGDLEFSSVKVKTEYETEAGTTQVSVRRESKLTISGSWTLTGNWMELFRTWASMDSVTVLVAAYIKNGRPYYRQYVFDVGLGSKRWLDAELLVDEPVDSFRIHRLNDYRLGFELSNENRNLWLYTSRTYVAQSVPREIENFFMQENLAFLYCPADTDLSVHYELLVSEDLMNIQIGVDRELVCFDKSMRDVITFNEDSVEYSDVEKISYENFDGSAIITILLKKPPAKLITHIYINAARSNDLQCRIGQWGTIVSPSGTLTIDTTIYRRMQMEENIGIRSTGIGLQYSPIRERRQAMKETVTFAG